MWGAQEGISSSCLDQHRGFVIAIIDRRELHFDVPALLSVVAGSQGRAQAIGLPPLKPKGIELDADGSRVYFLYDGSEKAEIEIDRLGALLVSYCVRARIPLPRSPAKQVRVTQDSVVIALQTLYPDARRAW